MSAAGMLDHLAIGVVDWSDGFDVYAAELGGAWSHGGDAGEFAPYQLVYRHGFRLEFIAPGSQQGFMHRFIDRDGPGAHHITFKVPSLERALDEVAELGIEPLGGRTDVPFWQEAFLHPKTSALGTLIQLAEVDDELLRSQIRDSPRPPGFPEEQRPQRTIAWVGLTTSDMAVARALLLDTLDGTVEAFGDDWMLASWGPGRRLLVRSGSATPGGAALWADAPLLGVAHVVVEPSETTPDQLSSGSAPARRLPHDPRTRVPVWMATDRLDAPGPL
ncbi:VOC family protein [Nocardioides sp. LHG3406-4]|uniref:VOC family protein n=1 Tax=Nocardioides sp. LHG3406-4 TaxID=2804575 RepID=UPI003CEDA816